MTQTCSKPSMAEFFSWKRHPFADTRPINDPYLPETDQRIFSHATGLLAMGKSFAICGPSGAGKTTLLTQLLTHLDPRNYRTFTIPYGGHNRAGLLKLLAGEMGVDSSGRSTPLLSRIHQQAVQMTEGKQPHHPVFVVDDAHLLERESLLDLCALLAVPARNTVTASMVLVGDQTFPKSLSLTVMAPVLSRLACTFSLSLLNEDDCAKLIRARLAWASAPKDLFEPQAITLMATYTAGNRRILMNIATMLLQDAFDRGERSVSAQLVLSSPFCGQEVKN